jgi:hypothetical protein
MRALHTPLAGVLLALDGDTSIALDQCRQAELIHVPGFGILQGSPVLAFR